MFRVLIALEEVAHTKSLAEACQIFIKKIKDMIAGGGVSQYVLYETCMIEGNFDGTTGIMNFDAIVTFSHEIGLLTEKGALIDKATPYVPPDFAREVFASFSNRSFDAFLVEQHEVLCRIAAASTKGARNPQPSVVLTQV